MNMNTQMGELVRDYQEENARLKAALARLLAVVDPADPEYGKDSEAAAIEQAREALE